MKSGVCVKCGADQVHVIPGNRSGVGLPSQSLFSSGSFVEFYFCGACGYIELYVEKAEDLPGLAAAWPKVSVSR